MNTIFMNSENSKTFEPRILILNFTDKLGLRRGEKSNLKHQLQHGMINLNYQMDHFLYQIFKTILSILLKSMEKILITINKNICKQN